MATDYGSAAQWALHAIREGWSARAGLDRYRAEGGRVADATWYKMTGELNRMVAERETELTRPLSLRPTADDIREWTTRNARGYIHQVEVLVRDRATGEIISVPYSAMSRQLKSRISVINEALRVYSSDNAKKYDQQVLGAVYTGTYQAVPEAG